jgi:hypothetical protein
LPERYANFLLKELAEARLFFHNQDMIRGLREQPGSHALSQRLKRISSLAGHPDRCVNKIVYVMPVLLFAPLSCRANNYTASLAPDYPRPARQIFVRLAYGIVMNLQAASEFPDARQSLTWFHFLGCDGKYNLFRELLPDGYVALFVNPNIHRMRTACNPKLWANCTAAGKCDSCETVTVVMATEPRMVVSFDAEGKLMRYDNIFWVLAAPGLASCACFAFERFCNFTESWNDSFDAIRRGFEMIGGKAKNGNIHVFCHKAPAPNYAEASILVVDQKRTS